MSRHSLRLRLTVAATLSVALALLLAGFGLAQLFRNHVEARIEAELATYLRQLVGSLGVDSDGTIIIDRPLADGRFDTPLSGLYWQIQDDQDAVLLRSRSLWDQVLTLPDDILDQTAVHRHDVLGPRGEALIVLERSVVFPLEGGDSKELRLTAALDETEADRAVDDFAVALVPSLVLLALVLIAAALAQITIGLRPLARLAGAVADVRGGRSARIGGDHPDEVMPLVGEVNDLLDARDDALAKARARAGNLAHGLKTPLTVLLADAAKLRAQGEVWVGEEIEDLVATMGRHVDHELALARLASQDISGQGRPASDLAQAVRIVVGVVQRLPQAERVDWLVDVPETALVGLDRTDLEELVGNLIDNAAKWAVSEVVVTAREAAGQVALTVADDGPGVPPAQLDQLGRRGLRLDESVSGSGLGLAIVHDLAAAAGGRVTIVNRPLGGLAVTVALPTR